ncbi:MAG TPA: hypothetical protein VLA89_08675 [Gemmatimonadales bacterium]|nr:hypothetical protein [Gemmatimonadales bacterium]
MLRVYQLLVPLALFPAATDLVCDQDHPEKGVTIQLHLPPGVVDVPGMLDRMEMVLRQEVSPEPQPARPDLRLLA